MAGRFSRLAGVGLLLGAFASSADAFDAAIDIKAVVNPQIVIKPNVTKRVGANGFVRNSVDEGAATRC